MDTLRLGVSALQLPDVFVTSPETDVILCGSSVAVLAAAIGHEHAPKREVHCLSPEEQHGNSGGHADVPNDARNDGNVHPLRRCGARDLENALEEIMDRELVHHPADTHLDLEELSDDFTEDSDIEGYDLDIDDFWAEDFAGQDEQSCESTACPLSDTVLDMDADDESQCSNEAAYGSPSDAD